MLTLESLLHAKMIQQKEKDKNKGLHELQCTNQLNSHFLISSI